MRCSEEVLALAERGQKREFFLHAHLCLCIAHFGLGEFPEAVAHGARVRAPHEFEKNNDQQFPHGYDPFMLGRVYEGLSLSMLGYPIQALEQMNEELTAAQRVVHPFFELFVRTQRCLLFGMHRDYACVLIESAAAITLAGEIGNLDFHAWTLIQHGCALMEMGDALGGEEVAAGFAMCSDLNSQYILPVLQAIHAVARLSRDDTHGARSAAVHGLVAW